MRSHFKPHLRAAALANSAEASAVPDGWQTMTLGEVADFKSGGTPSKGTPAYWTGDIPWVSAKDMKYLFLEDTQDHLSSEGARSSTRVAPAGTVLLLTRGMTLLNDLPISVASRPMAFNQDVKAVIPKAGLSHEFLLYLLLGNKLRLLDLVDLAGHGTGRINTDELKNLQIRLPPPDQQREISEVLRALDQKIDLNRKMSATLEAMARALFKSWFVDFDPVRVKAAGRDPGPPAEIAALFPSSFEDSEIGEIPAGWDLKSLDDIADFLNGLALQKFPPRNAHSLPVIKIAQLRSSGTAGADRASRDIDDKYVVCDGDVLFSWSGSLECRIWSGGQGALNQHLFKVTSRGYPKWLYYLGIHHYLDGFRRIAAGKATTMGHIQRRHLTEAKLPLPSSAVLAEISKVIGPLIDHSWRSSIESRTLSALCDTLLPKLISGEIRLEPARSAADGVLK